MANRETWSETAASNNSAAPDGFPENMSSAGLNDAARELMAALAKEYRGAATYGSPQPSLEWLDITYGKTITRVSDTEVTVGSYDATTWAVAGRRVRIVSASASADGYVTSSSFSTNTTVNVEMDGGTVPSSPTKMFLHVGGSLRDAAFTQMGTGNGLDADTVDTYEASQLFPAGRNALINGRFDVWQRGTSFTADGYTADRWRMTLGSGGAATVDRQAFTLGQTDVPGEPTYYMRWDHTTNSSSVPILEQRIESVRSLAGKSITVSFYAKAGASLTVTGNLEQNFGTTGSPSTAVDTSLSTFAVTTSWTRFTKVISVPSISGKTLGSDGNDYLAIQFEFPTGATFTADICNVQVEVGTASDYEVRPLRTELRDCQRYYRKTFPQGTTPAQNIGYTGAIVTGAHGSFVYEVWQFGEPMRAAPSVTTYAPDSASSAWSANVTTPTAYTAASDSGVYLYGDNATDNGSYSIHATADAEL